MTDAQGMVISAFIGGIFLLIAALIGKSASSSDPPSILNNLHDHAWNIVLSSSLGALFSALFFSSARNQITKFVSEPLYDSLFAMVLVFFVSAGILALMIEVFVKIFSNRS